MLEKILDCVPGEQALKVWKAPQMKDDLHDFEGTAGNLEVKTSASVPDPLRVHLIDGLQADSSEDPDHSFRKLNHGEDFTLPEIVNRLRKARNGHLSPL